MKKKIVLPEPIQRVYFNRLRGKATQLLGLNIQQMRKDSYPAKTFQ